MEKLSAMCTKFLVIGSRSSSNTSRLYEIAKTRTEAYLVSSIDDVYKIIREEQKTALLITHDISEAISVADKIFVLSKRPATIIAQHRITFPESEPLKRRENKEFSRWFEVLWKELNT